MSTSLGGDPPPGAQAPRRRTSLRRGVPYPHGMHPALVPGVSVESQRVRYGTDPVVLGVTVTLLAAFIAWGVIWPDHLGATAASALDWTVTNTGWVFNLLAIASVVLMLFVGISHYGRIPLGLDGEEPEYDRASWLAMLFSAGMGIGLLFFGVYEPMTYYLTPPPGGGEAETYAAMETAMSQVGFHYGLTPWSMYAVVGAAVAYSSYRRGRVPLMSRVMEGLLGRRVVRGPFGHLVDMLAISATLFGTATTLGFGAVQIRRGLEIVTGIGPLGNGALIALIAVLTAAFIVSAVSGVSRGIRYLSNINMVLALLLALFVFLVGPTVFLLNLVPTTLVNYVGDLPRLMGLSAATDPETADFVAAWTVFYWAWWLSWTPFVGMFIAKISRGRTLREFTAVVLVVPTVVSIVWFSVFGGTAMLADHQGRADMAGATGSEEMLFRLLDSLPMGSVTSVVAMVMLGVFFVTSADSGSIVMGTLSQRGNPEPDKPILVLWGLLLSGIAVVMLLVGGEEALSGLQNIIIVSALPFTVVFALLAVSFLRDLATDPMMIRAKYAESAVEEAVRRGVSEHGDDFVLTTAAAQSGEGAGADFDSTSGEWTDWYRFRDEDGELVETAEWPHPADPSSAQGEAGERA